VWKDWDRVEWGMTKKNDFSDYVLKEYERLSEAYFKSHENTATWIKYYLLIIAAPSSVIAFIYKGDPYHFYIFRLPEIIAILISMIGFLGILITFIIINLRIDSTLYARAVNGVRRFYLDIGLELNGSKWNKCELEKYLVLPTDTAHPKFFKFGSDLFWLTLMMGTVNSLYIMVGITQIQLIAMPCIKSVRFVLFLLLFLAHFLYYYLKGLNKEATYGKK
jgi:hypothetical protein